MAMTIRLTGAVSRLALGGAGLVLGLAACGTIRATADGSPAHPGRAAQAAPASAGAALCADRAHLTVVSVTHTSGLPQPSSRAGAAQPAAVSIREAGRVRTLAASLCGLGSMPHATVNCPAAFGGGYQLVFGAGGRTFGAVEVATSGCRTVTGLGPVRMAATSFWRVLDATLGSAGKAAGQGAAGLTP